MQNASLFFWNLVEYYQLSFVSFVIMRKLEEIHAFGNLLTPIIIGIPIKGVKALAHIVFFKFPHQLASHVKNLQYYLVV